MILGIDPGLENTGWAVIKDGRLVGVGVILTSKKDSSQARLKKIYEEAISLDQNIVAISIATRPDCLSKEIVEYLGELNQRLPVWVELGLQTIDEQVATFINRGYQLDVFTEAVTNLHQQGIEVIVHIINGLPNETKEMMLNTIRFLNSQKIQGIKIHSLFILKQTILGNIFEQNPFKLLTLTEYVDIVCEQLTLLREDIVIHRLNGDAPQELLIEPRWSLKKLVVMNEIDKEMKRRNYFQGCKVSID